MSYLLARVRSWAAHHRIAWWSGALAVALLTGLTVQSATAVPPCPAVVDHAADRNLPDGRPGDGERGVALGRGADPLPVVAGDRVDLWGAGGDPSLGPAVDRLVVPGARVLVVDDRTLTVAVPTDLVADVTGALRWGALTPTLLPTGPGGPQRTPATRSVSTASPATTR